MIFYTGFLPHYGLCASPQSPVSLQCLEYECGCPPVTLTTILKA